ncbi:MAG: EAL domain-containing protein [Erysipelotrichaceae bacterium]|nr:EAL domain-containing protein [Erysipelotrichaceae bacterium]
MKQKYSIMIYMCIWTVAIILLVFSLNQNAGYAKVINYSGIVRGGTQKLVKEELHGVHDEKLLDHLDTIMIELQTGKGPNGLMKIDNTAYQNQLTEMAAIWNEMKQNIQKMDDPQAALRLYELSQDYFDKADEMVNTAQHVSDQKLIQSTLLFLSFIIITSSSFIFWYRSKQKEIRKVMYIDKLTRLPNRTAFELGVQRLIATHKQKYVLLYFDIDDFKYLNGTYGYTCGDQILIGVADAMVEFIQNRGVCARDNSDCFFLLAEFEETIVDQLQNIMKQMVKQKIELDIADDLSFTFGAYEVKNEVPIQDMIDNVILAHKNAKALGRGNIIWYNQELLNRLLQESLFIKQMHTALKQNEFRLYLQPKFEIDTLKITGAESLVRWHMQDGRIIYPDTFISLFEKNGYIYDLDFYMLERTCEFLQRNQCFDFTISVNFSRVSIHHKDFYEHLHAVINAYQIPVSCIEIEITESAFNGLSHTILTMLRRLSNDGFLISMDDFGSGYSSLNLLTAMQVDILKIDRAFLEEQNDKKKKIIKLIVELAATLHMRVICEGVETEADVELLRAVRCQLGQGYYISKPIPAEAFSEKYLQKHKTAG